jgi:hypothetical protein
VRAPPGTLARVTPDGRSMIYGDREGRVWIYYTHTWRPRGAPRFVSSPLLAAEISPDGRQLATTSADGKARLWDIASGRAIGGVLPSARGALTADRVRRRRPAHGGPARQRRLRMGPASRRLGTPCLLRRRTYAHACRMGERAARSALRTRLPLIGVEPRVGPAMTPARQGSALVIVRLRRAPARCRRRRWSPEG